MFQFPSFASLSGYWSVTSSGFPHSEILGSKLVSSSPGLIAAVHVLHRLLTPRHPPCALSSLTTVMNTPKESSRAAPDTSADVSNAKSQHSLSIN